MGSCIYWVADVNFRLELWLAGTFVIIVHLKLQSTYYQCSVKVKPSCITRFCLTALCYQLITTIKQVNMRLQLCIYFSAVLTTGSMSLSRRCLNYYKQGKCKEYKFQEILCSTEADNFFFKLQHLRIIARYPGKGKSVPLQAREHQRVPGS